MMADKKSSEIVFSIRSFIFHATLQYSPTLFYSSIIALQ